MWETPEMKTGRMVILFRAKVNNNSFFYNARVAYSYRPVIFWRGYEAARKVAIRRTR